MKRFLIEEGERNRILNMHKNAIKKNYLLEQETVPDSEWQQFSDRMMKEYLEKYYQDEIKFSKRINKNERELYNNVYRQHMELIDKDLKEMGFPNGFQFKEPVLRNEFEELKNKWETIMK